VPYDYEVFEERGKKRANRFFKVFFAAYERHPREAVRVRNAFASGKISYEDAIRMLKRLAEE